VSRVVRPRPPTGQGVARDLTADLPVPEEDFPQLAGVGALAFLSVA
jgi:hypothetical protein